MIEEQITHTPNAMLTSEKKNLAVAVAFQMKSSFLSIWFSLMVGIGGGVLSKEADI